MTALLADRVAAYVSDHPGCTFAEIRRAIPAREKSLRDILADLPFTSRSVAKRGRNSERSYWLGRESGKDLQTPGKDSQSTHKSRVLALLSDGRPHSHMEGYRLNVMLHSRVADLRRDGYRIDCYREGDLYWYRLLGAGSGEAESALPAPSSQTPPELEGLTDSTSGCSTVDTRSALSGAGDMAAESDGQLVLAAPEFRRRSVAA